jgi:hypothetical protein
MAWRPNTPQVVSETIGGEVIVIHFERGTYYSLRDTGAEIWGLLDQGHDEAEVVAALAARYPSAAQAEISSEVRRLIGELEEEGLIAEAPSATSVAPAPEPATAPFSRPLLEKFTDLEDLLVLDPIHEVEPEGWPATGRP